MGRERERERKMEGGVSQRERMKINMNIKQHSRSFTHFFPLIKQELVILS